MEWPSAQDRPLRKSAVRTGVSPNAKLTIAQADCHSIKVKLCAIQLHKLVADETRPADSAKSQTGSTNGRNL